MLLEKEVILKLYELVSKDSGRLYAIKIISKKLMNKSINTNIIVNECEIQMMLKNNPLFVNLYWTFQDEGNFYLVTELCIGGSLFNLMNTHSALEESTARFYACEVLLMLEDMHNKNIIYRDLKPENILIDLDGHLKLADFGLAKIVKDLKNPNDTFWGSPDYLTPEMFLQDTHNSTIDFYTFGWLLHEMVSELPPHYSKSRRIMNANIMFKEFRVKFDWSPHCADLLQKCLSKNKSDRPSSVKEIMNHPFFK